MKTAFISRTEDRNGNRSKGSRWRGRKRATTFNVLFINKGPCSKSTALYFRANPPFTPSTLVQISQFQTAFTFTAAAAGCLSAYSPFSWGRTCRRPDKKALPQTIEPSSVYIAHSSGSAGPLH